MRCAPVPDLMSRDRYEKIKTYLYKAGFPLVDFFRTKRLFPWLIHHITQEYQLLSRSRGEKKR